MLFDRAGIGLRRMEGMEMGKRNFFYGKKNWNENMNRGKGEREKELWMKRNKGRRKEKEE